MKHLYYFMLAFLAISLSSQAQFSSQQDGSWHSAATWGTEEVEPESARIPGATDNVTINHSINSIIASPECANLYLGATGELLIHTTVNGTLTNYGYLGTKSDPNFRISLEGDLFNYGIMEVANFYFFGTSGQTIYHDSDTVMKLGRARNNGTNNPITIANTTTFEYTAFLGKGNELIIADSVESLEFMAGTLDGIVEANGCVLQMDSSENGSASSIGWTGAGTFDPSFTQLKNATIESNKYIKIMPSGTGDWGVELYNCTNNATLGGNGTLYLDSTFVNNGRIEGHFSTIYASTIMNVVPKGHFIHKGSFNFDVMLYPKADLSFKEGATWDNTRVYMDGTSDQEITFYEDVLPFYFKINANVTDATTFQWYRNDELIAGQTSASLDLKRNSPTSIDDIDGEYYCVTDQGDSRKINVTAGHDFEKPLTPSNLVGAVVNSNDTVHLTWDANTEIDLAAYNVYRDDSLLTATTNNFYSDSSYYGASARYYVSAIDTSGNESTVANASISYPQVHSTEAGGSWQNTTTWVGGLLPTSSDSVIINGPVSSNMSPTVSHIYVTDSGSLEKDWNTTKFIISGNLYIDGEIFNCNGDGIEIGGNLRVNGKVNSNTIKFTGTSDHHFYMHDTATVISNNIGAPESRIIAKTDLYLGEIGAATTQIYAKELDLSEGFDLYLQSCRLGYNYLLDRSYVKGGNGSVIYSNVGVENNQYFCEYIDLENVSLYGNTYLKSGVKLKGEVVNEDSMLISVSNNGYAVEVEGNFTNNGYVYTDLKFNFHQDFTNNGPFQCGLVSFVGNEEHELKTLNQNIVNTTLGFSCDSSKVIAMSDLYLSTTNTYSYNVVETDLSNGFDLHLNNLKVGYYSWGKRAMIKAAGNSIKMYGSSSYFDYCDLYDAQLQGVCVASSYTDFYGSTEIADTLVAYSTSSRELSFYGDLTNTGLISSGTRATPTLILHQGFVNNGLCDVFNVKFVGDSIHELSTLNDNEIYSNQGFSCDSSKVLAMSDLYLTAQNDVYNVIETDLSNGYDLHLTNTQVGYYLWDKRAVIKAAGNQVKMIGTSSYYNKCDIYDATLRGVNVFTSEAGLYGNVILQDTLTGYSNTNRNLNVYGSLTNNGKITSAPGFYTPALYLHQSFTNNGLCNVFDFRLVGDSIHEVASSTEMYSYLGFTCDSSKVMAMSDLYFTAQNDVYNVVETDLSNGFDLYLTNAQVGYYLWDKRSVIKAAGNEVKMMGNSAYYNKCDIYNATLRGVSVATSEVKMYGDIVLQDTLVGYSNTNLTPSFYGNFTNNGYIGGTPDFYKPSLDCYGNIISNASWDSYLVKVMGDTAQTIYLGENISSQVEMISDNGASAFQWKKDDVAIADETSSSLVFATSLSSADEGVYVCANNEGSSRSITVTTSVPTSERSAMNSEAEIKIYPNPTTSMIKVENVNLGASYRIISLDGRTKASGLLTNSFINVASLDNGLYFIEFNSNNERYIHEFIKK